MKQNFDYLLDYIYPRKCLLCEELIPLHEMKEGLCQKCHDNVGFIDLDTCPRCAYPLFGGDVAHGKCAHCNLNSYAFLGGHAAFRYERVSYAIEHFKFDGFKTDAEYLAKLMTRYAMMGKCDRILKADIVTSVPLHIKRLKHRGFNQAELLARGFCEGVSMNYEELLIRHKNTKTQSTLSHEKRHANIKDAFSVIENIDVDGKLILIIDDVFTTGGSINECAKVLYAAGAKDVLFYTLAVA